MQKFGNFAGQARHGLEKMTPSGFMSRPNMDSGPQPIKRPLGATPMSPMTPADSMVNLSFNVPFSSNLPGPDPDEILHASPDALQRWTFPEGTDATIPIHKLPVHSSNVETLRRLCRIMSESSGGRVEASVTSSEPKAIPALQRRPTKGLITNVCVSGDTETVHKMRAKILNETPIALVMQPAVPKFLLANADRHQRCAFVDIDTNLVIDQTQRGIKANVLEHIDTLANFTGTDIFLLNPKTASQEGPGLSYGNGDDHRFDQRLRIAIYGDPESSEHAKTRVLIMIDQIVGSYSVMCDALYADTISS